MRTALVLALAAVMQLTNSYAQSVLAAASDVQQRTYKLLREDEDWSFLADAKVGEDFWDRLKYIQLRKGRKDWFATIGGEAREVWEQIGNDNWRQHPFMNGYFNELLML